jgi:CrcB protein
MTGFLGGFTTFSAFSLETVRLFEQHLLRTALLYISGSLLGGILAAAAGLNLARLIFTLK